jgi:hypothetical protein
MAINMSETLATPIERLPGVHARRQGKKKFLFFSPGPTAGVVSTAEGIAGPLPVRA